MWVKVYVCEEEYGTCVCDVSDLCILRQDLCASVFIFVLFQPSISCATRVLIFVNYGQLKFETLSQYVVGEK